MREHGTLSINSSSHCEDNGGDGIRRYFDIWKIGWNLSSEVSVLRGFGTDNLAAVIDVL